MTDGPGSGRGIGFVAIDHVQLAMPVGGEDQARAFYGSVLGLTEVAKPAVLVSRGGAWFQDNGVRIHLGVEEDFRFAKKAHPAISVDDLGGPRHLLEAAGCSVKAGEALDNRERIFTEDPFGNRLEFLQIGARKGG